MPMRVGAIRQVREQGGAVVTIRSGKVMEEGERRGKGKGTQRGGWRTEKPAVYWMHGGSWDILRALGEPTQASWRLLRGS
eukprot:1930057-Pyramimonas_sp.AAC.1